MEPHVRNFLYRNPQFYELVYPEPDERTPQMCLRMFARYLTHKPSSILDLGCGTGRDLDVLSRGGADCRGLEHLLSENGFDVLGMFDNMELNDTELSGPRLYVASRMKQAKSSS